MFDKILFLWYNKHNERGRTPNKRRNEMIVKSRQEAWKIADEIFNTDYEKDDFRSKRAGYDIYFSTVEGVNAWISDLGDRLEVNLENGKTENIFIDDGPRFTEYQIADALEVIDNAIYEIDDKVNSKLADVTGIKEAENMLYRSYAEIAKILKEQYPESKLCKQYNLE